MTLPTHVALIGCGFTGTSAFFQLVDRHPVKEITIYEASGDFGPGFPYGVNESEDYLLNNTNDTLCIVPSNRRAFTTWLRGRPEYSQCSDDKGHMPRAVFGVFLKDVFAATRTIAAVKNIKVNLIPEEATSLQETRDGCVQITSASATVEADVAILTTGRCPHINPVPGPPTNSKSRYFGNHVGAKELDLIPLDATVHILGASLSAYDVINRLYSVSTGCHFERVRDRLVFHPGPNQRKVTLCSRTGRLKGVQSRHPMNLERKAFSSTEIRRAAAMGSANLETIGNAVLADASRNDITLNRTSILDPYSGCGSQDAVNRRAGELLRGAIDAAIDPASRNFLVDLFSDAQVDLWDVFAERPLSTEEETLYRSDIESSVLSYAAPCPVSTAQRLLALHEAGCLQVIKGVHKVRFETDADAYCIDHSFGTLEARILVNTTGLSERDVLSASQPALVRSLVEAGLLMPDERDGVKMKGAAVDMTTFRAKGSRCVYVANMLLWGPGFFTSSAFMMATVVERLLTKLYAPQRSA